MRPSFQCASGAATIKAAASRIRYGSPKEANDSKNSTRSALAMVKLVTSSGVTDDAVVSMLSDTQLTQREGGERERSILTQC